MDTVSTVFDRSFRTIARSPSSLAGGSLAELERAARASVESRLLATVALVCGAAVAVVALSSLAPLVRRRYGSATAEASRVAGLGAVLTVGVYALSAVWRVTYVVDLAVAAVTVDRWTAALLLVTGAVIALAYLLIRFLNRSIDELARANALTDHQREVAYHVADVGVFVAAVTVVLTLWGVDLTNVFLGAGAIAALVAVAARETVSAMLAGFILLFSRPFRVGDWIAVNDRTGIVVDVTIFNTKIQTFGDEYVLVPNDEITSSQLTNRSRNDRLRVEIEVGIDYETDVARARSVIVDAVDDCDSIRDTPTPEVAAKRFGDSAVVLEVHVWIGDPTMRRQRDAKTDAIEAIKSAFDREGIEIPFPQRVHQSRNEAGFRVAGTPGERVRPSGDD